MRDDGDPKTYWLNLKLPVQLVAELQETPWFIREAAVGSGATSLTFLSRFLLLIIFFVRGARSLRSGREKKQKGAVKVIEE